MNKNLSQKNDNQNNDEITLKSDFHVIFQGLKKRLTLLIFMVGYIILYYKIPNKIHNKISNLDINFNVDGNYAFILLLIYLLGSFVYLFFYLFNYRKIFLTKPRAIFYFLYLLIYILFLTVFSNQKQHINEIKIFFLSNYRPALFLPLLLSTLVTFGKNKHFKKFLLFLIFFPAIIGVLDLFF